MPQLVSVIVAVRNGGQEFGQQLQSLAAQRTAVSYELIVADNGSTDGSVEAARSFGRTAPMAVTVISAAERAGKGWAIRKAAEIAKGEALAICDADDVADCDWLQGLVEGLLHADAVGGRLDVKLINSEGAQAMKAWSATADTQLPIALHNFSYFVGANCALWRDCYDEVGGWDIELTPAGDDVDICIRLAQRGYRIDFVPQAVMHYRLRRERRSAVRQAYTYGKADSALVKRYRHLGATGDGLRETALFFRHAIPQSLAALAAGEDIHQVLPATAFKLGRLIGSLQYRTVCL